MPQSLDLVPGGYFIRYHHCVLFGPPRNTQAKPRWAQTEDGCKWLLKHSETCGTQEIVAEAFSKLLGDELKVRIPPAAILVDGQHRGWLSQRIAGAAHWSPEASDRIINLDEVAHMVVLDAVIGNADRHGENVLMKPAPDEANLELWAIDHGSGQAFDALLLRSLGEAPPSPHVNTPILPYERLKAESLASADRLSSLDEGLVIQMLKEAWACVDGEPPLMVVDLMLRRCRLAPGITKRYLNSLGVET